MDLSLYERSRRTGALAAAAVLGVAGLTAFVYQLPAAFFPFRDGPWWLEWLAFAVLYMAYATASLPFDIWAGYWLRCRHGLECRLLPVFLGTLFRAEGVQFAAMTLSSLAMLEAGKRWGTPGALAALAATQGLLVVLRARIGRFLGSDQVSPLTADAWMPGYLWNLGGMALMLSLPWCGAGSAYELMEAQLGGSLWSLLGYGLLRKRRRQAALALLYQSWAVFGLFSRATAGTVGSPERWAAGEDSSQGAERNSRAASQISSTWSRSS